MIHCFQLGWLTFQNREQRGFGVKFEIAQALTWVSCINCFGDGVDSVVYN